MELAGQGVLAPIVMYGSGVDAIEIRACSVFNLLPPSIMSAYISLSRGVMVKISFTRYSISSEEEALDLEK